MYPFDKTLFDPSPLSASLSSYPFVKASAFAGSSQKSILYRSRYYSVLPALNPVTVGHIEIVPNSTSYQYGFLDQTRSVQNDALSLIHDLVGHIVTTTDKSVLLFEEVRTASTGDFMSCNHRLSLIPVSSDMYGMLRFLYTDWKIVQQNTQIEQGQEEMSGYQMMRFYPDDDLRQASPIYVRPYAVSKPSDIIKKIHQSTKRSLQEASITRKKTAALF